MRKTIISALIGVGVLFASMAAGAVGLGKLTVTSGLGQPFQGEIELLAVEKNDVGSITARLASYESFRDARIERASILSALRISVEQRKNGEHYLKLTSVQPVNDPFLDMLIELNWPSGRLLREFTVLLDPPAIAETQVVAPVPLPLSEKVEKAEKGAELAVAPEKPPRGKSPGKAVAKPRSKAPVADEGAKPAELARAQDKAAEPAPQAKPVEAAVQRQVKAGDTLGKIAASLKPEGVSLDQMLVTLYQANPEAFVGNNMNRLKVGQILRVPENTRPGDVDKAEASKEVRAHTADWNAYRQKLAGAVAESKPTHDDAARQSSGGKIAAKTEDKAEGRKEPAKDVLKLSRSEGTGSKSKAGAATGGDRALQEKLHALQEEAIAREKSSKEAGQRIAELEKNIKEMQRLLDIRSKEMTALQSQAAAGKPGKAEPAKPAAKPEMPQKDEAKPTEARKEEAKEPAKEPASAAETAKPVPAQKPAEEAEKPVAKPKQKPPVVLAPKPAAPSFLDTLLADPMVLGGGIVALLLGVLLAVKGRLARGKKPDARSSSAERAAARQEALGQEESLVTASLVAHEPASGLTDFTHAGLGTIDTNDVDPVAEAEVYMAYGRDVQAEEILTEALGHDPQRHEIHLKLLEIYAARRDRGAFEALARQLYAATGGMADPEWESAASMGRGIDPDNPLYGATQSMPESSVSEPLVGDAPAEALTELQPPVDSAPDLDFNLGGLNEPDVGGTTDIPLEAAPLDTSPADDLAVPDLDFDLDLGGSSAPAMEEAGLEMAVGASSAAEEAPAADHVETIDFNFEMPVEAEVSAAPAEVLVEAHDDLLLEMPALEPALVEEVSALAEEPLVADVPQGEEQESGLISAESWKMATTELELNGAAPEVALMLPEETPEPEVEAPAPVEVEEDALAFDLDLPLDEAPAEPAPVLPEELPAEAPAPEAIEIGAVPSEEGAALDFDFSMDTLEAETPVGEEPAKEPLIEEVPAEAAQVEEMSIGELLAGEMPVEEILAEEAPQMAAPNLDLSDIDLELDVPAEAEEKAEENPLYQEVATKLDLARAYMEMGDREGAREILQEVIRDGVEMQQEDGRKLLAELG